MQMTSSKENKTNVFHLAKEVTTHDVLALCYLNYYNFDERQLLMLAAQRELITNLKKGLTQPSP